MQLRHRSYWSRVGLEVNAPGVVTRGEGTQTQTCREEAMWRWRQTLGLCSCKPKNTKGCQQTPEARREVWSRFSAGSSESAQPCRHLDVTHHETEHVLQQLKSKTKQNKQALIHRSGFPAWVPSCSECPRSVSTLFLHRHTNPAMSGALPSAPAQKCHLGLSELPVGC